MTAKMDIPFADLTKPGRDAFEYWISFFPTAPMFGVEWRYSDMVEETLSTFAPQAVTKPRAGKPAPKAAKPAKADVAPAPAARKVAEAPIAEKPTVAEKTQAKAAPKVVDAPTATPAPTPEVAKAPAPKPVEPAPEKPVAKAAAPVETAAAQEGEWKPAGLLKNAPADADDLKLIKGVGPGLESELNALGVYRFRQMAKFSKKDLTWVDDNLTAFKGRCFRDDWVGQAKDLMA